MKKRWLLLLIFLLVLNLAGREKIEKIGSIEWYTEQNSFEEIKGIAQKENKPILAVFSATWCGPCQYLKKNVFNDPKFKKVQQKALLLYIEQTTREGREYCRKFNVRAYPTIHVYAKEGHLLDAWLVDRSVNGFLNWFQKIDAGNSYYALSKQLKKTPNNRRILIEIVNRIGHGHVKEKIGYLKRAIALNKDFKDPLSQQAYEKLINLIIPNAYSTRGNKSDPIIKENIGLVNQVIQAYYPDEFKHEMASDWGKSLLLNWFRIIENYKQGIKIFEDYRKQQKENLDLGRDILLFPSALTCMLHGGKTEEADKWMQLLYEYSNNSELNKNPKRFNYSFSRCYPPFIEYFAKQKKNGKAEDYAGQFYDLLKQIGLKRLYASQSITYANKYGLFAEKTLKEINEKINGLKGTLRANHLQYKIQILRHFDKAKAVPILKSIFNDPKLLKDLKDANKSRVLNSLAWALHKFEENGQNTLKIAEESVKLDSNQYNLDTLATILAEMGRFKEAIKTEKDAIKKMKPGNLKEESLKKIENWEQKLK